VATDVLVTGGTGTLGRLVVPRLRAAGCRVRVLTRHPRDTDHVAGDLVSGSGVDEAVAGVQVIVHCAGTNNGDEAKTLHLIEGVRHNGIKPHLVYISVVGADRIPVESALDRAMFVYFASKRAAERVIEESGLPWTTLRATQFFDLALLVARQMARLPLIPVPAGVRFQPVDADEVAARLVDLALGAPAGLVPDIAGPRIYPMADMLRGYLHMRGLRRLFVPLWLPGKAAAAVRHGGNLSPERAVGRRTWEEFLTAR
jgi:uncharacterized protein YbjT (DUF2867 family)